MKRWFGFFRNSNDFESLRIFTKKLTSFFCRLWNTRWKCQIICKSSILDTNQPIRNNLPPLQYRILISLTLHILYRFFASQIEEAKCKKESIIRFRVISWTGTGQSLILIPSSFISFEKLPEDGRATLNSHWLRVLMCWIKSFRIFCPPP